MIKKYTELPDSDHVVRHVNPKRLDKDEYGNVYGALPQAFDLRPIDEGKISVCWVEFYDSMKELALKKLAENLVQFPHFSKKGALAIATVAKAKEACLSKGKQIRIIYAPSKRIKSHSLIQKFDPTDIELLETLANDAFSEVKLISDL